ncbi:MAG: alpha/beta fold hydrolase [Calditrichaeota bacterium]|nr:MAG: alpha/beta fold hydrolase [Calditrichota bacterium]MBL1205464.1 alpha/beta fold hydrolase [Calditrichota bacterium]NOG45293.1 alpha/beta fold hydrolase [Calditrichota bacterium]
MNQLYKSEPIFKKQSKNGLLMLHGFTATPYEFLDFSKEFEQDNYSLSIPLLRGHGKSVEDLKNCHWYQWFEDAKNALFELRKICDHIFVIGQSMGGTLALHLASHYQVEGVILLAPGLFLKQKGSSFLPAISPFKTYFDKKDGPDIKNEISRAKAVSYDKTPVKGVIELKRLFSHVKKDLPEVYAPTLLFHSQDDHVIDYKSSEYIYDHISSKNKRILTLTNSYHVLSLDNEKNIIKKETKKFIARILK